MLQCCRMPINGDVAFLLAPFFVFLEVLFYFGYRPALQSRFRARVAIEVKKYRDEQAEKVKEAEQQRSKALLEFAEKDKVDAS